MAINGHAGNIQPQLDIAEHQHASEAKRVWQVPLLASTNVSSTLTLTSASTAYQPTAAASDYLLVMCNASDTDMYWGFATLTTGGILLAKNGGVVAMILSGNKAPYIYCASAGKVLNYSTTVL